MIFDKSFKYTVLGMLYLILASTTVSSLAPLIVIIALIYMFMGVYWAWKERNK